MTDVLIRAGSFVGMVVLGYLLKLAGVFKKEDFSIISKVVMKVTLPAAIIVNLSAYSIDISMLFVVLIGLGSCGLCILCAWLLNFSCVRTRQAFAITNVSGYNIGCFTMPFAQHFLGPVGVVTTSLFDVGNAFFCLGGGYGIATSIQDGRGISFKRIFQALGNSVPFLCYLVMVVLNLARLELPDFVMSFVELIAGANVLMAMLMLGIGFELHIRPKDVPDVMRILAVRYGVAAVLSMVFYFALPFSLEIRKALVILLFSPIGSTAPAFTDELGGDVSLSSTVNSMSILISIGFMITFLTLL